MFLNFEEFNFAVTRLRYLDAAVTNIPNFKPDGRTADEVGQLLSSADQSLKDLLKKYNESNTANAALQKSYALGHEASVSVYACMKSCYRKDSVSSATGVYDATGVVAGAHEYKVVGVNSRGPGPESAVASISVAAAAAA
jgi:hypothetical protein